jgi:formamidopyrimidine-DNA glycosylase
MPELPEVETIRRQLAPRLTGRRVSAAWAFPHPKFDEALLTVGATVSGVGRRGKYLIAPLDDGRELIMHLGMTGAMGFVDEPLDGGDLAPADPFVRARFRLDDDATLELHDVRRFGRVAVVEAGHYDRLPTLAALGPEPLSDDFTPEHLWRALARSRRAVKTQLLSQRVVAGVGNIYADEALWRAQVSPMSHRVGLERATVLRNTVRDVLAESLDHGGTRLRNYRTVEGDTGAHQLHLDCYGRAGLPCIRCGTELRYRDLDGRGTTWCPSCQAR